MPKEGYTKINISSLNGKHALLIENMKSQMPTGVKLIKDKKVYISFNKTKKEFVVDIKDLESVGITFDEYLRNTIASFMAIGLDVYLKEEK